MAEIALKAKRGKPFSSPLAAERCNPADAGEQGENGLPRFFRTAHRCEIISGIGRTRIRAVASCFMESNMSVVLSEAQAATVDPREAAVHDFEAQLPDCLRLAFRVALGVLHNREGAEDVAQEAMLRAFQNLGRLRDRERLRAWVVRIAWRLAIDHRRADDRRQRRELTAARPGRLTKAEELAASTEFEKSLLAAIDELPEKLRMVLLLAGIQGYDTREVALLLRLPEGTVKSRLHSARKKLAERLPWIAGNTTRG
jgi:RNA polymerase sigma-70 factor, ECF subfamily